jgi:hypothetical protein
VNVQTLVDRSRVEHVPDKVTWALGGSPLKPGDWGSLYFSHTPLPRATIQGFWVIFPCGKGASKRSELLYSHQLKWHTTLAPCDMSV